MNVDKSGDKMLNNKGFTLVEILAVLVILAAIMGLAIPSFSSSLEVSDKKQEENRKGRIESAAEIYVTNNRRQIYENLKLSGYNECYIFVSDLEKEGYISSEDNTKDGNNKINGVVKYNKNNSSYEYLASTGMSVSDCLSLSSTVTIDEGFPIYYIGLDGEFLSGKISPFKISTSISDWDGLINGIKNKTFTIRYFCNIGLPAELSECNEICEIQGDAEVSSDGNHITTKCIMRTQIP